MVGNATTTLEIIIYSLNDLKRMLWSVGDSADRKASFTSKQQLTNGVATASHDDDNSEI